MSKIIVNRKIISKNPKRGQPEYSMQFEIAVRHFLGEDAYHIADLAGNPKLVKKYFKRVGQKIIKDVAKIDTNPRHKSLLLHHAEKLLEQIENEHEGFPLILNFFGLVSCLLGYDFLDGKPFYNVLFWQNNQQYFDTFFKMQKGKASEYLEQKDNLWKERNNIISELKNKGYDNFQLSIIFNTTEYDITKTLKSFQRNKSK